MVKSLLSKCEDLGLRLTDQRRSIVDALESSLDHPSIQELYDKANRIDPKISIATVYRTVNLLAELNIITKLEFGDGVARYEAANQEHHDHLIDINSGEVIEFVDEDIECLQKQIAERLGYTLCGHRLELYGVPLKGK